MNHWLHILPPTPKILNGKIISYPFYCEMTARFTIKDLVNLFYIVKSFLCRTFRDKS